MRKIIAALALVAGLLPAVTVAQAPPPVPALPDTERRTSYSITSQTGPFAVNFALYGDGTDYANWVQVYLISGSTVTQLTGVTDWTLSSPSGSLATLPRPITDATITLTAARTGTLQIVGARRPRRTSQFNENRGVAARDLNQVFTDVVAENRERWDQDRRTVQAPPGETLNVLPPSASRAGTTLCFDGSGQVSTCNITGGGNVVGPGSSTVGHLAVFNSTNGTVIADFGNVGAGNVVGNPGAAPGSPSDATLTSILDRALGSGNGFFAVRGGVLWTARLWGGGDCVNPSAATFGCVFSNPASGGSVLSGIDNSGNPQRATQMTLTGQNSLLVAVGRQGATQPTFSVDSSVASSITGITIAAQAAGNGVNLTAQGEANVPLIINAAGNGTVSLNPTATGVINAFRDVFINHNSTPTLTFGNSGNTPGTLKSQGSGGFLLKNNANETIAQISPSAASGIISWGEWAPQTGTTTVLRSAGTGADHGLQLTTKGSGTLLLATGGGTNQVTIPHIAGANRLLQVNASNGGNPTITTAGGGNLALTCGSGCGTTTISPVTGAAVTGGYYPNIRVSSLALNLNSLGAETSFTITPPSPGTRFRVSSLAVVNTGTTASLTTAQLGIYSATAGGGTAFATAIALTGCTSSTPGAAGQFCAGSIGTLPTRVHASGTQIFVRVDTAQGAAATGDILLSLEAIQ